MAQVEARALSSGDDQAPECVDTIEDSEGGSADQMLDKATVSDGDAEEESDGDADEGSEGDADEGSEGDAEEGSDGEAGGGSDGDEGDESQGNAGWADAMAKILGKKTTDNKGTILVKNAALDKAKAKERQEQLERKKQLDKRHAWEMMCREKPEIVRDRETEKALQRIATRGVVQLFNAVRKHQKTVDSKLKEVGGSERKKAKILTSVSKKDFIDVLRGEEGGGRGGASKADEHAAPATEDKPAWSVLRDDYMMGATMKDWDKESDAEEAEPQA